MKNALQLKFEKTRNVTSTLELLILWCYIKLLIINNNNCKRRKKIVHVLALDVLPALITLVGIEKLCNSYAVTLYDTIFYQPVF